MRGIRPDEAVIVAFRGLRARFRIAESVVRWWLWAKEDLAIRLWLAQLFLLSGTLKLTSWQSALELAAYEYPVRFMTPLHAAYAGVTVEVVGGVLFALGFLTRYAAIPLLTLSLVIQVTYKQLDEQLFWAALFGWYAIVGAGPISVDALLRRGLADSALPVVPALAKLGESVRTTAGPVYLSLTRLWLATACLTPALEAYWPSNRSSLSQWLPLNTASVLPASLATTLGLLLLVGLGTRFVSVAVVVSLLTATMVRLPMTGTVYVIMIFSILALFGGGPMGIDAAIAAIMRRMAPDQERQNPSAGEGRPKVVIVGAGFAGVRCATALRHAPVSITLIDRTNHHLFQPLLYQVATAGLSPGDIATPTRQLFRDTLNTRVLLGSVSAVDTEKQWVLVDGARIPYDFLVLATGATHSYFGKDDWAPFAPGLKHLVDAIEIRSRLLSAFERAEFIQDSAERAAWLTFLVVGGGPTGVELAGAIAELARSGMDRDFRSFDPADAKVMLVQSAPRLLPSFPDKLSDIARRSLERLGIEVRLNSRVEHIDDSGVIVSGRQIAARTVLWAAGVKASPAAHWLQVPSDAAGRVKVDRTLRVPGLRNVFAIGDTALSDGWNGRAVPGLASAAKQAGAHVARTIGNEIAGRDNHTAFRYRHLGNLATIGRKSAVVNFGVINVWGAPAWWLWGILHIGFLVGIRNRVTTLVNWFWAYLTLRGGIRLITASARSSADYPSKATETSNPCRS